MQNYLKSEWFRAFRSREFYLLTGILCAVVVSVNLLLWFMHLTDPNFRYATAWFSLSNLISSLPFLFFGAGLVVALLYADDKKNGILKNALVYGISRPQVFVGKIILCVCLGLLSLAVVLAVYIASATLLLEGPALEPISYLLEGVGAALPSVIAVIVLTVIAFTLFNSTTVVFVVWIALVVALPGVLSQIGTQVEWVATIASWIPSNFLSQEVLINMSGAHDFLWDTSFGLMKCLVVGAVSALVFAAFGIWRTRKVEL